MAKKNGKFDLNKGTERKFDIDKGSKRKFNLSKDIEDDAVDAVEAASEAPKTVVTPTATEVKAPEMQVPASTAMPDLSQTATDIAIEEGPAEPKRKNTAWLWALIGVAIVLAFIAMLLLRKGDDKNEAPESEVIESVEATPDSEEGQDAEIAAQSEDAQSEEGASGIVASEDAAPEASADATAAKDEAAAAPVASESPAAAPASKTSAPEVAPQAPAPSAKTSTSAVSTTPTGDLEEDAKRAIRGDYGDGSARKNVLGDRYREVQRRVNQRMRSRR
ncbi:MAG: hypothetical protein K2M31_03410 [Muribaculaceae bacterium]|nr:hypothetical protein [Muribaculaceae bacterium]